MYDVIIIGAGVAGLSAAIYASSRGMKTLILESDKPGGVLGKVSVVTHYAGIVKDETGKSIIQRIINQVEGMGLSICMEEVVEVHLQGEIKKVVTTNGSYETKTIIIANGTTPRKLNIPGEEALYKKGVSYNAVEDGDKYKDKEVFVVGGSDGAVKETLYLATIASKVTLIHFEDQLGAVREFTDRLAQNEKITLRLHSRLKEIKGEEEICSVFIEDEHTKEVEEIKAKGAGVFIYAGALPNSKMYEGLEKENDFIITNETMCTNIPGVFAAGDIRHKMVRQAATAVADGAIATISAKMYL